MKKIFLFSIFVLSFVLFSGGNIYASNPSSFHVSELQNGTFVEVYSPSFPVQYTTKNFNFNNLNNSLTLKINESGDLPYSGVDAIILNACGTNITPSSAFYSDTNESVLDDILNIDLNVVISHDKPIQVSWNLPQGCSTATLSLNANEYGIANPFRFPGSGNASYNMGSNSGSLVINGIINETDGTTPLYSPYWTPSTGHPAHNVYFYVEDDTNYLYFAADIAIDNTDDYGPDWISITIGGREFKVTDADDTYGKCIFGLTSKVSYKHQTCELKIPKNEISYTNNTVPFVLGYYGTGGISISGTPTIPGIISPGTGEIPTTTGRETDAYTSSVVWSPADSTFVDGVVYTATITLTPKAGYFILNGVPQDIFSVAGATSVTNDADSGIVTAIFPAASARPLTIGDSYQGGAIAYILQPEDPGYTAGQTRGLIAAERDQDWAPWITGGETQTTLNGNTSTIIATGQANTNFMIAQSGYDGGAAKIADDYINSDTGTGIYSDWYLPSKDELYKFYLNKEAIGNFVNNNYWSSSEDEDIDTNAWDIASSDGGYQSLDKNFQLRVRVFRSFVVPTIGYPVISGVTVPVTGATPTATISDTTEYRATISWNGDPATFAAGTAYTATITITPKTGYSLVGVPENFFTVAGTTTDTNSINSGVITAVFPATEVIVDTSPRSSGSSASSRYTNLLSMGNIKAAEELRKEFPTLPIPIVCSLGDLFNSNTGLACPVTTLTTCSLGDLYSTTTGAPCPAISSPNPNLTPNSNNQTPSLTRTLKLTIPRMTGDDIKDLQTYLNTHGYSLPNLITDGAFGIKTSQAVINFQKANGLVADGIVGPKTLEKMK